MRLRAPGDGLVHCLAPIRPWHKAKPGEAVAVHGEWLAQGLCLRPREAGAARQFRQGGRDPGSRVWQAGQTT